MDKKGSYESDWRLIQVDYTTSCRDEWIAEKGIESIGMIYLVDANLHVHICSLFKAFLVENAKAHTPCLGSVARAALRHVQEL